MAVRVVHGHKEELGLNTTQVACRAHGQWNKRKGKAWLVVHG